MALALALAVGMPWHLPLHLHLACHGTSPCTCSWHAMALAIALAVGLPWHLHLACHGTSSCTCTWHAMARAPALGMPWHMYLACHSTCTWHAMAPALALGMPTWCTTYAHQGTDAPCRRNDTARPIEALRRHILWYADAKKWHAITLQFALAFGMPTRCDLHLYPHLACHGTPNPSNGMPFYRRRPKETSRPILPTSKFEVCDAHIMEESKHFARRPGASVTLVDKPKGIFVILQTSPRASFFG